MAKHRADERTPDEVIDVEIVPIDAQPIPSAPATPLSAAPVGTEYTTTGVPTFDSVREKIETRFGTSVGAAELAAETPEGRSVEEQYDARHRAAADRVAQIRASLRDGPGPDARPA